MQYSGINYNILGYITLHNIVVNIQHYYIIQCNTLQSKPIELCFGLLLLLRNEFVPTYSMHYTNTLCTRGDSRIKEGERGGWGE